MITKEIIKNSLDAKWRKRQMRIWIVVAGIYIGVFLLSALIASLKHGDFLLSLQITGIYAAIWLPIIAPFLIYNIWCYYSLLKNPEEYKVYEVMLDKPETSYMYRGAIYYKVSFTDGDGNLVSKDTRPLWSSGIFDPCQLADYNNKKVFVAYRESTDTLIVLGKEYK
jgi:hypothetical protein